MKIATNYDVLVNGERSPAEWAEYCKEGERESLHATIAWCVRIYEAKQNLKISFREWTDNYYTEYGYSSLHKLCKIGEKADKVCSIATQREVSNDWYSLYELLSLTDDQIDSIEGTIDRKAIKSLKYNHNEGDEWYTPSWLFDSLGLTFDYDVCSPIDRTHTSVPAFNYFTEQSDGLDQDWCGLVWCNPPYSNADPWARKMVAHGNGLLLTHIPANAEWCADVWQRCDGIRLFQAMEFMRPDGNAQRPGYWLQLAAFGDDAARALSKLKTPADVAENERRVPSPMFTRKGA